MSLLTMLQVQEVQFAAPVHDPNKGVGRTWLEGAKTSALYRIEYDREFGIVSVTHLLGGEPHPDSLTTFVPISNVRSMRIAVREHTTTVAPPQPTSRKSA